MDLQKRLQQSLQEEEDTSIKIQVLETIQECVVDTSRRIHEETVIIEATQRGYNEEDVIQAIYQLERESLISIDDEGFMFLK